MYKALSAPLAVQIEITDNCNEACSHCYRSCQIIQKQSVKVLDPQNVTHIISEVASAGVFSLALTGGEPLLYPETVKMAIASSKNNGLVCNINTNLQPLTEQMAVLFAENDVRVLTSLTSLDERDHDRIVGLKGSHRRLLKNIRLLSGLGVKVSANMVVRSDNAQSVYDTGVFAKTLGVSRFSATKAAPTPGIDYASYAPTSQQIKTSLDDLLRLKDDYGMNVDILESYPLCFFGDLEKYALFIRRNCTAGVFNCSIGPDGNVRPCSHSGMSYGNVLNESLQSCWLRMDDWRSGAYIHKECRDCPYLLECSGGCRTDAETLYGDIKGRDPLMTNYSQILPAKPPEEREIYLPEELILVSYARIRKEAFGGVLRVDDNVVFLGSNGFDLIFSLTKGESFSWRQVSAGLHLSEEEVRSFFVSLFERGAVVPAEEKSLMPLSIVLT